MYVLNFSATETEEKELPQLLQETLDAIEKAKSAAGQSQKDVLVGGLENKLKELAKAADQAQNALNNQTKEKEEFKEAQEKDYLVIDIRRPEEWAETGILEGAKTITAFTESGALHPDFQRKFFPLIDDEDTPIYLYCRTGNRTGTLGNALVNQVGLRNVTHLETGIVGWKKNGFLTVPYQSN